MHGSQATGIAAGSDNGEHQLAGFEQAREASKRPGLKMLRPDFNLKLFELVATLSAAGALKTRRYNCCNQAIALKTPAAA